MNSERLISQHALANGLILELWDHSRPLIGDRWYVVLETRIAVPVGPNTLPPELKALADQVVTALGEKINFTRKEERNFISAAEFPGLLQEMQDRILKLAPDYFGHPDFAASFIRGKFAERQKLEHWQRLDTHKGGAG